MDQFKKFVFFTAFVLGIIEGRPNTFWQITDIHLDNKYSVNGTRASWCHENASTPNDRLNPFGDFSCDAPLLLVESAVKAMKERHSSPDFILWTGDNSPHWYPDSPDWDYIYKSLKHISNLLASYFPETPIIPVLGNHDSSPADYYVDDPKQDLYSKYIEEGSWGDFLKGEARDSFKKCGFYSMNLTIDDAPIKFIVLNTNLYYHNEAPLPDLKDPCGQMQWYQNELLHTATNQIPTIVTAHVPPGYFELQDMGAPFMAINNNTQINDMYVQLSSKPNDNILAHIYGHAHTDTFRLFMKDDEPVHVGFLAPSVTPLLYQKPPGVNPGIRLYQYDLGSKEISNYWQYYLPLDNLSDDTDGPPPTDSTSTKKDLNDVIGDANEQTPPPDRSSAKKSLNDDEPSVRGSSRATRINSKFLSDHRRKRQADPVVIASSDVVTPVPIVSTTLPKQNDTDDEEDVTTLVPDITDDLTTVPSVTVGNTTETEQKNATDTEEQTANTTSDRSEQLAYITGQWSKEYEAKQDFEIEGNLTPRSMYKAFQKMKDETSKVFNRYYKHNRALHAVGTCNSTCKQLHLCAISCLTVRSYNECMQPLNDTARTVTIPPVEETTTPVSPAGPIILSTSTTTTSTTEAPIVTSSNPHIGSFPANTDVPKAEDHVYVAKGVAISFSILGILAIGVIAFVIHRRIKKNRYRSQEFLLTDSVFRFDGYSQLDT